MQTIMKLGKHFWKLCKPNFCLMHKLCKGKVPPLHADVIDDADKAMFVEIEMQNKS
jgi:methionyl-tRNA synthetase